MRSSLFCSIVLVIVVTVNAGYVKEIARRYRPRNHSSPRDSNNTEQQFANGTLNFPTNADTAMCGEPKFADFIDSGLRHYQHDMGQLSKYILDQIVRARYWGNYVVHAQMIGSSRQGLDWQTLTNSDIFQHLNKHNCYYHDTQTYILILRIVT